MPTFDLVVLGSGGGPYETNLSGYLLKSSESSWEDGIVALEAGSGLGALSTILRCTPDLFRSTAQEANEEKSRKLTASGVYSLIRSFVVTHAHLDHVNSLVLSAGALQGPRKQLYAAPETLKDIEGIFADRLWPNLASWNDEDDSAKLLYRTLHFDDKYTNIWRNISVRAMPLNHGSNDTCGIYESAAFFIRHDTSQQEFLFFGDVEPDTIAARPQTINVWRVAAAKIPQQLNTIFIECSWTQGRKDEHLFGHLNPEHLAVELTALATEVVKARKLTKSVASVNRSHSPSSPTRKRHKANPTSPESLHGALAGVRVYVVHCKDDMAGIHDEPINHVIAFQVRKLVEERGLGAEILYADQGMRIEI